MPGGGRPWKTASLRDGALRAGFPPPPTALGNRSAIPTFPQRRPFFFLTKTTRKDPSILPTLTAPVQAHPSMRIC